MKIEFSGPIPGGGGIQTAVVTDNEVCVSVETFRYGRTAGEGVGFDYSNLPDIIAALTALQSRREARNGAARG